MVNLTDIEQFERAKFSQYEIATSRDIGDSVAPRFDASQKLRELAASFVGQSNSSSSSNCGSNSCSCTGR